MSVLGALEYEILFSSENEKKTWEIIGWFEEQFKSTGIVPSTEIVANIFDVHTAYVESCKNWWNEIGA